MRLDQLGRTRGGERFEVDVVTPDFLIERQPAPRDGAQGGQVPDQRHLANDAVELLA